MHFQSIRIVRHGGIAIFATTLGGGGIASNPTYQPLLIYATLPNSATPHCVSILLKHFRFLQISEEKVGTKQVFDLGP
jgi:hypothetical protein